VTVVNAAKDLDGAVFCEHSENGPDRSLPKPLEIQLAVRETSLADSARFRWHSSSYLAGVLVFVILLIF